MAWHTDVASYAADCHDLVSTRPLVVKGFQLAWGKPPTRWHSMSARPPEGKGSQSRLLSQAISPRRGRGLALAMQRDKSLHNFPGLCSHAHGVPKALLTPFASASDRGEQGVDCFPRVCHSASVALFWRVGWLPEISMHCEWGKVPFVHRLPLPTSESPG